MNISILTIYILITLINFSYAITLAEAGNCMVKDCDLPWKKCMKNADCFELLK